MKIYKPCGYRSKHEHSQQVEKRLLENSTKRPFASYRPFQHHIELVI